MFALLGLEALVSMIDGLGRGRRWARSLSFLAAYVAAASCSDSSSINGIAPGQARLSLEPRFATTPAGGPVVTLSRIDAYVIGPAGDSTFATASFVEGSATLSFDILLPGKEAEVTLDLTGFDGNGVEAYHARQKYKVKAGNNDDLTPPVLVYSAPDSRVQSIHVAPAPVNLEAGASTTLTVSGMDASNAPVSPVRVGWTSRNPAIATVDDGGVVTAMQVSGQTYIVARTPTNVADSVLVTARGAVIEIAATPASVTLFRGATSTISVVARDPAGNALADRAITFASSNDKIASVSTVGVVSGVSVGSATITVSIEGKSTTVPVTVASPVAGLELTPTSLTLSKIEESQQLTARVIPQPGASTNGLVATFKSSDVAVVTVDATGRVTATGFGTATITASIETFTATTSVSVVSQLILSPPSIEKLPKGTQQFTVISGGKGPFTWTVNGVVGGNSTYGTISTDGFYNAPDAVPTPASFEVCASQANPASQGCAKVTINPIPTSGADVIVFNDINFMDNGYAATNAQLFKNLARFPATGARSTATAFMRFRGHASKCASTGECSAATQQAFADTLIASNIPVVEVDDPAATLTTIAPNIKAILLLNPTTPFSNVEINALKQFASEGGRLIFVGEHYDYYGAGAGGTDFIETVENPFLQAMGAVLRNPGINGKTPGNGVYACPGTASGSGIRTHQLSTGVTAVAFACSTEVELGPNDFAIFTVNDQNAERILVAAAKIDVTPIELGSALRRPSNAPRSTRAGVSPTRPSTTSVPAGGPGVPGWRQPPR